MAVTLSSAVFVVAWLVACVPSSHADQIRPGYQTRYLNPSSPERLVNYMAAGYGDIILATDSTDNCRCQVVASVNSDYTRFHVLLYLMERVSELQLSVQTHQQQTTVVTAHVEEYTVALFNLTERMDFYDSLETGELMMLSDELAVFEVEIHEVRQTLVELEAQQLTLTATVNSHVAVLSNVSDTLATMFDEATVDVIRLQAQIETLQSELDTCYQGGYNPQDLPADFSCNDGALSSIGEPFTHRWLSVQQGVWMKDPLPLLGKEDAIYVITGYANIKVIYEYDNMDDFVAGIRATSHAVTLGTAGTGHVVYNGALYYPQYNSANILRYNLTTGELLSKTLPNAGYQNLYPYSIEYYTDIDLAVDETGLWAIYSTGADQGMIVISRLDPDTMNVTETWHTNIDKESVGNSFMICGRLYVTDSPVARFDRITNTFDTSTNRASLVAIPISNKYRLTTSLDYNPRERRLYAWDNYHLVSFDLTFA